MKKHIHQWKVWSHTDKETVTKGGHCETNRLSRGISRGH